MRKPGKYLAAAVIAALCMSTVQATNNSKNKFVGPTLDASFTGWFSNDTAYSLLAEIGAKNYRINATAGWMMENDSRMKFSAEYLWQQIEYSFFSGRTDQWVQQVAAGLDYQRDLGCAHNPIFDLSLYASHAPNKGLSTVDGFTTRHGVRRPYSNVRNIAGSNAWGIAPGIIFNIWPGAQAAIDLNYDDVRYTKAFVPSANATGFGASARLTQALGDHVVIDLLAEDRKPFDNYYASINWANINYKGRWGLGLFGEYTYGKEELPSTYNAGLSVNYFADCLVTTQPKSIKGEIDYKNEAPLTTLYYPGFLAWISDPAVYMPQVLAVPDQNVNACTLGAPVLTGLTISPVATAFIITAYPTAFAFKGKDLKYSISISPGLIDGDIIDINSTNGLVYIAPNDSFTNFYTVTVTASNVCGSVSTTFGVDMLVT